MPFGVKVLLRFIPAILLILCIIDGIARNGSTWLLVALCFSAMGAVLWPALYSMKFDDPIDNS